MTQRVVTEHGLDRRRVFVAGLSAGAAMAAILVREFPQLYAACGLHSGLVAGAAGSVIGVLAAI